jgi:hypothetical protein
MYRRPKFLKLLIRIREEMAREADFDVDLFVERVRTGQRSVSGESYSLADDEELSGSTKRKRNLSKQT